MNKRLKIILVLVLIVIIAFSIYKIVDYLMVNACFNEELEEIQQLKFEENISASKAKTKSNKAQENTDLSTGQTTSNKDDEKDKEEAERIRHLQESYKDLVGWIAIAGTEIDFPLMYSKNNYFYLDHNYKGKYHPFGTPYIDAGNRTDFTDQNTVIYGHNVRSGKVFHDLTKYMNKGFIEKAPEISITTSFGILRYEIFAAYVADPYDNFRSPTYEGEIKTAFLTEIDKRNLLDKSVPRDVENFLTLQTCLDNNQRLVIHGKLK